MLSSWRRAIWRALPREELARAKSKADQLARSLDDLLASRYSHVRQFAPAFLAELSDEGFSWSSAAAFSNSASCLLPLSHSAMRRAILQKRWCH